MDTDHVIAWSKRGSTTLENCEMLCKTHNRSNGNKYRIAFSYILDYKL
ncbi:HNH endonuclease [bacterium]|nr:HNH endonuclease [bacterium]